MVSQTLIQQLRLPLSDESYQLSRDDFNPLTLTFPFCSHIHNPRDIRSNACTGPAGICMRSRDRQVAFDTYDTFPCLDYIIKQKLPPQGWKLFILACQAKLPKVAKFGGPGWEYLTSRKPSTFAKATVGQAGFPTPLRGCLPPTGKQLFSPPSRKAMAGQADPSAVRQLAEADVFDPTHSKIKTAQRRISILEGLVRYRSLIFAWLANSSTPARRRRASAFRSSQSVTPKNKTSTARVETFCFWRAW